MKDFEYTQRPCSFPSLASFLPLCFFIKLSFVPFDSLLNPPFSIFFVPLKRREAAEAEAAAKAEQERLEALAAKEKAKQVR